jgi:hypothetical protein
MTAALLSACRTLERPSKERSEIAVAAWAEPSRLPHRGGQVQILIRVRRPNGNPYPAVQVHVQASRGRLFSNGKPLVTAADGTTRDRLTSKDASEIVVQVGDTRYRFNVPLAP